MFHFFQQISENDWQLTRIELYLTCGWTQYAEPWRFVIESFGIPSAWRLFWTPLDHTFSIAFFRLFMSKCLRRKQMPERFILVFFWLRREASKTQNCCLNSLRHLISCLLPREPPIRSLTFDSIKMRFLFRLPFIIYCFCRYKVCGILSQLS